MDRAFRVGTSGHKKTSMIPSALSVEYGDRPWWPSQLMCMSRNEVVSNCNPRNDKMFWGPMVWLFDFQESNKRVMWVTTVYSVSTQLNQSFIWICQLNHDCQRNDFGGINWHDVFGLIQIPQVTRAWYLIYPWVEFIDFVHQLNELHCCADVLHFVCQYLWL